MNISPLTTDYNGKVPEFKYSVNVPGLTANILAEKDAGHYASGVKVEFSNNEYDFRDTVLIAADYTINKAPLAIYANDATKIVGDDNPNFSCAYFGFVNGEDESVLSMAPTMGTTANKGSKIGTYPIIPSGAQSQNYSFTYHNGTLSVVEKVAVTDLTINRNAMGMKQGDVVTLEATVYPSDASVKDVRWISSNTDVAKVEDGTVTAVGAGSASVKAISVDNEEVYAVCFVRVADDSNTTTGTFDFAAPTSLSPAQEPSAEVDDAVNIIEETFTTGNVDLTFSLGTRTNYSAKLYTLSDYRYEIRTYTGAKLKFSVPEGSHIIEIKFKGENPVLFTCSAGTLTEGTWAGNANAVEFTCTGTTKISSISVKCDAPLEFDMHDENAYSELIPWDYDIISYTRNFTDTNWQAFYVPFAVSCNQLEDDFQVARINAFYQYDDDRDGNIDRSVLEAIIMHDGELEANYPYLIRAKVVGEKTITLKDVTLSAADEKSIDCSTVDTKFTFTGNYKNMDGTALSGLNAYMMQDGKLTKASEGDTMTPYRWYLTTENRNGFNKANEANIRVRVVNEPSVTGIEYMEKEDRNVSEIYSIDGRRVNDVQRGLFIVNGKKTIGLK